METRRYIEGDFVRDVDLPDGTRVRLRLLRPKDRAKLAAAARKLSPESRYLRFLSATTELSDHALHYLTDLDNETHLAIAAGSPAEREDDEEGWGVARFVRPAPGATTAEAAVTVLDEFQGRGLGRLLLAALTLAARERGVERFTAEILSTNIAILSLLRHIGATVKPGADGDEVVDVDLPLPALPASGDFRDLPDGAGAQLLRFAAEELSLLGVVAR